MSKQRVSNKALDTISETTNVGYTLSKLKLTNDNILNKLLRENCMYWNFNTPPLTSCLDFNERTLSRLHSLRINTVSTFDRTCATLSILILSFRIIKCVNRAKSCC